MNMTMADIIRTHTSTGKWKKAIDHWTCIYIKCVRCGKEYKHTSGKAIAKHDLNCKIEYIKKYR